MPLTILPPAYQSGSTSLSDWLSLLTLCLTPLAVHLLAGVPTVSYLVRDTEDSNHSLGGDGPRWHDTICHYNPTSILWRYVAIADRRIRARRWSAVDMAAASTVFWTARGWDGSETTAAEATPHCRRVPSRARVELFSLQTAQTVVVAAQGCQALSSLFVRGKEVSFESLFFPLAILGLARMFPALWLTADYEFVAPARRDTASPVSHKGSLDSLLLTNGDDNNGDGSRDVSYADARFRPSSFWASRAFRLFCFLLVAMILVKSIINFIPPPGVQYLLSTTTLLLGGFYIALVAVSIVILCYYWVRAGARSTIIPCISATWYKVYTVVVFSLMAAMFVVAAVETRKSSCGVYTTFPGYEGDRSACFMQRVNVIPLDPEGQGHRLFQFGQFGLATNVTSGTPQADMVLGDGEFLVDHFSGACLGHFTGGSRIHASTSDIVPLEGEPNTICPSCIV